MRPRSEPKASEAGRTGLSPGRDHKTRKADAGAQRAEGERSGVDRA